MELVVMGANQLDAYDPKTGKQIWFLKGFRGGRLITGPIVNDDVIYCCSGFRLGLHAVRPSGEGEQSPNTIAWTQHRGVPDTCCPVIYNNLLFTVTDNGIAQCYDRTTGELFWSERLNGSFKSSPIAAGGRIYFLHMDGHCTVVAVEKTFRVLAMNEIEDEMVASPVISDGFLYLRGKGGLYAIAGAR
jgi:outer membrane protein assembly factor BamB